MITSALFVLLSMQGGYGYPTARQIDEMQPSFRPHVPEDSALVTDSEDAHKQAAARARQFQYSFNHLLETLRSFADTYNADGAVNIKQVNAIKKAWRDLESSDPWFKLNKNK